MCDDNHSTDDRELAQDYYSDSADEATSQGEVIITDESEDGANYNDGSGDSENDCSMRDGDEWQILHFDAICEVVDALSTRYSFFSYVAVNWADHFSRADYLVDASLWTPWRIDCAILALPS